MPRSWPTWRSPSWCRIDDRFSLTERDLDAPLDAAVVVGSEPRGPAGRVVRTGGDDVAPATLGRVEPVHVRSTSTSTVPALGAGTEHGEQEAPAGVPRVSLALGTHRKVGELDGEAEPSREGAPDSAVVVAEETGAATSDGRRVPIVAQCVCERR